jgi:hypothetical protein
MLRGPRAPRVLAAGFVVGLFAACGGSGEDAGVTNSSGGTADSSGGRGGADAGPGGTAGATGGNTGSGGTTTGGTGGATGGSAGSSGGTAGSPGGTAGSPGGTAGSSGGTMGLDAGESDASADGSVGAAGTGGADAGVHAIDRCPGPLAPTTANALRAGGSPSPSMKWLYPYDRTVFPRGILPPVLQWAPADGAAVQAAYVHIKSKRFEYQGCFGPSDPARIPLPDDVWTALTANASGAQDPVTIEITTSAGGKVSGPIQQAWTIAPAILNFAIYYNTYQSPQAQGNAAIMRIVPGQRQPQVYLSESKSSSSTVNGPCKSCHSLSANGKSMVVARHTFGIAGVGTTYESFSYDVGANPNPNPPALTTQSLDSAAFAAIYPDGSRFLTNGSPGTVDITQLFPLGAGNVAGTEGPRTSRLFRINGVPVQATGWNVQYAKMPSFSPDGKKIVFNNHDAGAGHSLSIMDFDAATNTFSNHVEIFKHDTLWPGWPSFTPDNKGVVFALGVNNYYAGWVPLPGYQVEQSDIYYVDIASKRAVRLAKAGDTVAYPGRDEHWDYFPTMSPVGAGGYFWMFFTSRRNYGNLMVENDLTQPRTKQIWGIAIDINPPAGADPSHPIFYLDGQETTGGAYRPVAVPLP